MKNLGKLTILVVLLISVGVIVYANNQGPETIKLATTRGDVTFHHWVHEGYEGVTCRSCHHTMTEGQVQPDKSCRACHTAQAEGDRLSLKDAMHKNCTGCHRQRHQGPITCNKCHIK